MKDPTKHPHNEQQHFLIAFADPMVHLGADHSCCQKVNLSDSEFGGDRSVPRMKSSRIMLIDDEPEILDVLSEILSNKGYAISTFTRGDEALRSAQEQPPDLVLLDVRMPEMDGYEICRRFKSHMTLNKIPILFLSAYHETSVKVQGFEAGAVDFITKPPHIAEVIARVGTHLALSRAYVELEHKNQALVRLEDRRDELVHMTMHDMRTPLQTILGHLEMLSMGNDNLSEEAMADIEAARSGILLLHRMMNDVLDVSRMKNDKLPVSPISTDLTYLFSEVLRDYIPTTLRTRIHVNIPDGFPAAYCDPSITIRIFANLLDNALKYSPFASPVQVAVKDLGDSVEICISDEGQGIAQGQFMRIFDKFYMITEEEGAPENCRSFGFGLAFCKQATEVQGGSISVQSVMGEGSTFCVTLPKSATRIY